MKVTLHCEDVDTRCARNPKDAHLFRMEINNRDIELAYMPNVGEALSIFTKRGWVEFTVGARGITYASEDSGVNGAGETKYGIWAEHIMIMRHNNEEE